MGVPDSCEFSAVAQGDGEKHVCMGMFPSATASSDTCSVVSVGSNNEYDFELDLFDRMPCEIHVFDCTVQTPTPPDKLSKSGRFYFYKLCIGSAEDLEKGFVTWRTLALLASRNASRPILSLKMDVEGWEFETLAQIAAPEMQQLQLVPMQIACEIHQRGHTKWNIPHFSPIPAKPSLAMVTPQQVLELKRKMELAGYVLADRNDNPYCKACSEVVFLHVNMYGLYEPVDWNNKNDSAPDTSAHHSTHIEALLGVPNLIRGGAHHGKVSRSAKQHRLNETLHHSPYGFVSLYMQSEIELHNCTSFVTFYPQCASIPYKDALLLALQRYEQRRSQRAATIAPVKSHAVDQEKVLVVHIRVGDKSSVDQSFLEIIASLMSQQSFSKLLVYSGIHADYRVVHPWNAACRLESTLHMLRQRFGRDRVEYQYPKSVDEDLYILSRSKHILVHRGAHAALVAMLTSGNVYLPERMVLEYSDDFYGMVSNRAFVVARNGSALPIADWRRIVKV